MSDDEHARAVASLEGPGSGLPARDRAIGMFMFYAGMRACDVAALRLDLIDWRLSKKADMDQSISAFFGSYGRIVRDTSTSTTRSFGQLFAIRTTGQPERIIDEPNVRPEILVKLGRGALIFVLGIRTSPLDSNFEPWSEYGKDM